MKGYSTNNANSCDYNSLLSNLEGISHDSGTALLFLMVKYH